MASLSDGLTGWHRAEPGDTALVSLGEGGGGRYVPRFVGDRSDWCRWKRLSEFHGRWDSAHRMEAAFTVPACSHSRVSVPSDPVAPFAIHRAVIRALTRAVIRPMNFTDESAPADSGGVCTGFSSYCVGS